MLLTYLHFKGHFPGKELGQPVLPLCSSSICSRRDLWW